METPPVFSMAKLIQTERSDCGQFLDRWYLEDGKVWRVRSQLTAGEILRENAERRKAAQRRTDGMRWALSIPQDDYDALLKLDPELGAKDREVKRKAWERFMKSDRSLPYRVQHSARGRTV